MRKLTILVALIGVVLLDSPLVLYGSEGFVSEKDQSRLSLILKECRKAAASITSGRGVATKQTTIREDNGRTVELETKYDVIFQGSNYKYSAEERCISNEAGLNLVFPPGTKRTWGSSFDGKKITCLEPESGFDAIVGDTYSRRVRSAHQGFTVDISPTRMGVCEPEKWLNSAGRTNTKPKIVGREVINGSECIVLEIVSSKDYGKGFITKSTCWYWVNPEAGYTLARVRNWGEGGDQKEKSLHSESNYETRKYGGIWVPAKATKELFKVDPATSQTYTDLRQVYTFPPDFQFNCPVSDEDLVLQLPSGTTVYDEIQSKSYTVEDSSAITKALNGAKIVSINVTGSDPIPSRKILEIMKNKTGENFNMAALNEDTNRIQSYYKEQGYIAYVMENVNFSKKTGILTLPILVHKVASVEITGLTTIKPEKLISEMKMKPGMIFNDKTLKEDVMRIYSSGLLQDIKPPKITPGKIGEIRVTIPVEEKKE